MKKINLFTRKIIYLYKNLKRKNGKSVTFNANELILRES